MLERMKKWVIRLLALALAAAAVGWVWSLVPKTIDHKLEGVKYRLGAANREYEEPVSIDIKGKMKKKLNGERIFTGMIDIEGVELPQSDGEIIFETTFREDSGMLAFFYGADNRIQHYMYGSLYANDDLSELAITVSEPEGLEEASKGWSGKDGLMIAAPAGNREEALQISQRYLERAYQGMKPLE